jgi:hypothetical protein
MSDDLRILLLAATSLPPALRSMRDKLSFRGRLAENLRLISLGSLSHGLDVSVGVLMLQTHFLMVIAHLVETLFLKEV